MKTMETKKNAKGNLPVGWRWVRLGDVGHFESGGTPSKENSAFWGGDIPFVTGADITDSQISAKHARAFLTEVGLASGKTAVCREGTVLFVTRTRVGRVGIATEIMGASQDLSPYICGPQVLNEYVCIYLCHIADYLLANCRGTTIQGLTREFVHSITFPLPPLDQQKRLAAAVREQMAAVEKARTAAQNQLEAVTALPAAFVRETLQTTQTRRYLLGDCLMEISIGVGADWSQYPVLGATRDGLAPAKEGVGKTPERYKLVDPVTVFYNPMRILLGSIAMVDEGNTAGITSPDYVVVKGRPGILNTRWFYYWFRSSYGMHLINSLTRGAVRERILFNRLAAGEIEIPDYETQLRVSERMKQVSPIVESITKELQAIDALPSAILREVFAGRV